MQLRHAVAPFAFCDVPASHCKHVAACGLGLYVPGAHAVGCAEPTGQNVPGSHSTHCEALHMTSSDVFMCVPPGQGTHA